MKHGLRLLLCFLILTSFCGVSFSAVQVTFLDVGQGDAIFIQTQSGIHILIDGGTREAGEKVVLPFLRQQGVTKLHLVVATHPHADHIGGLIPVLERVPVEEIWLNGQVHTTRTYEDLLNLIIEKEIKATRAVYGVQASFPDIQGFSVLHPQRELFSDLNNNSVVIRMEVGRSSLLFTGDIEKEAEELLLGLGILEPVTVLKVAHHGSRSSTTRAFLAATKPEVAVISCGHGNTYGHPHESTLQNLRGVLVYRTDTQGFVQIVLADEEVEVSSFSLLPGRINLLRASASELVEIPGIGPVLAGRIIDFRATKQVTKVEDFLLVTGIGPSLLLRLEEYGYVGWED